MLPKENASSEMSATSESKIPQTVDTDAFANTFPDKNLVVNLMQLSQDVFKVKNGVSPQDAISNPNYESKFWIEASFSTEAMIVTAHDNTKPIIVFRGSEEKEDWEVNFNFLTEKSEFVNAPDSVKIHRGFHSALFDQNVVSTLESKVLELIGTDGDVIVTGHSLGGANAHIMAAYLADKHRGMRVTMINFGAPRLGNKAFKTWTEIELSNLSAWRYVNRRDIVPRSIPGLHHAGHLFAIYDEEAKVYYNQIGKKPVYEGVPSHWYYAPSMKQHIDPEYVAHFQNAINNDQFWPTEFVKMEKRPWWNFFC